MTWPLASFIVALEDLNRNLREYIDYCLKWNVLVKNAI